MKRDITYTNDFVEVASEAILCEMQRRLSFKGSHFILSLCGGTTPFPVYARIAENAGDIDWSRVIITFGDERCVPPESDQSNYRAAVVNFLSRIPIPGENILRIKGELPPEDAATDYEAQLDATAKRIGVRSINHDLILLGLGDDGHTASLFPGSGALDLKGPRVVANFAPRLKANRITFTFSYINEAKRIMFLVNDAKKAEVIDDVLNSRGAYPAGRVRPENGRLSWIIGGLLPSRSTPLQSAPPEV